MRHREASRVSKSHSGAVEEQGFEPRQPGPKAQILKLIPRRFVSCNMMS